MKIYKVGDWQYWYDRSYRCWFAAQFDVDGNQVGACIDSYSKDEIKGLIAKS